MRLAFLSLSLAAAACQNDVPQAPTAQEAEQLNEAEAMLDAEAEQTAANRD